MNDLEMLGYKPDMYGNEYSCDGKKNVFFIEPDDFSNIGNYNAVGENKTKEEERAIILKNRLNLINNFILSTSGLDIPFGEYAIKNGWDKDKFLSNLPEDLQFKDLGNEKWDSKRLKKYAYSLALMFQLQYVQYIAKEKGTLPLNADADSDYFEARGDKRRKWWNKTKDKIKTLNDKIITTVKTVAEKAGDVAGKVVDKAKEDLARAAKMAKKIALAPLRGAFISVLGLNVVGIASALDYMRKKNPARWNEIKDKWDNKWIGESKNLEKAVDKGKNKRKLFLKLIKTKKRGADGELYYANDNAEEEKNPAATAAKAGVGLASIGGILALIPEPTSKLVAGWLGTAGGAVTAISPILKGFAKSEGVDPDAYGVPPPDKDYKPDPDDIIDPPTLPGGEKVITDKEGNQIIVDKDGNQINIDRGGSKTKNFFLKNKWYILGTLVVGGFTAFLIKTYGSKK